MASNDGPSSPTQKPHEQEKTPVSPAATSAVIPGPNPGDRLASYFDNFFKTIVGVSTLGASLTFSKILETPTQPWIDYGISAETVQFYLSISWLLFALALVLTSLLASLLSLYRPQVVDAFGTRIHEWKKRVMWAATITSLVLLSLVFASFIFLSLVIAAYAGPVGWTTLGFTILFGVLAIAGIIWQSPLQWPQWILPKPKGDPTRINTLPSTRTPSLPSHPSYGSDPFMRHMRLHGSLRHKHAFNNLHDVADGKEHDQHIEKIEKVGLGIGGQYYDDGYSREPPQPRREFKHDRREKYSGGDHFTQYHKDNIRHSGASTLVPGAYEVDKRWSNTIPPVRYSSHRPYAQTAFGLD